MATSSNQRCLIQRSTIYCIKICLCHWLVGSLNLRDFLNKNSIKEQNIGSDAELKLLKYVIIQRKQRFNILFKTSTVLLLILIKSFFKVVPTYNVDRASSVNHSYNSLTQARVKVYSEEEVQQLQ